jgi:hypothetical protein
MTIDGIWEGFCYFLSGWMLLGVLAHHVEQVWRVRKHVDSKVTPVEMGR